MQGAAIIIHAQIFLASTDYWSSPEAIKLFGTWSGETTCKPILNEIELLHTINYSDIGYYEVMEGEIDDETLNGFDKYVFHKKMCNNEPFSPAYPGEHEQVDLDTKLQMCGGGSKY